MKKHIVFGLFLIFLMLVSACGNREDIKNVSLTGNVSFGGVDPQTLGPVFIAVLDKDPTDESTSVSDALLTIRSVNKKTGDFSFALPEKIIQPGDMIYILAFADHDFVNGVPDPGVGDVLGYYLDEDNMSLGYTLKPGVNSGIDISLTKEIFDFEASLSGQVTGEESGPVTVVAYAGEINSLDFSKLDYYTYIIGVTEINKTTLSADFNIDIIPFGFNVPIPGVYLFAFLDKNGNGAADEGDLFGFMEDDEDLPATLTVNEGRQEGYTIDLSSVIPKPSGYTVTMSGSVTVDPDFQVQDLPLFILVLRAGEDTDISAMTDGNLDDMVFFYKIPANERNFSFDLSNTDLMPGEEVMILAVCDRKYDGGFPHVGDGDYMGYFVDNESMSPNYVVKEGGNDGIAITMNKVLNDYEASVSGEVRGGGNGAVTVFAYAGEINSMDFTNEIDAADIIGYAEIDKTTENMAFTVDIFPFVKTLPLSNVYLIGWLDANGNGEQDSGDKVGYVEDEDGLPALLTIHEGNQSGYIINLDTDVTEPTPYAVTMSGSVTVDPSLDVAGLPLFILVLDAENGTDMSSLSEGNLDNLVFFQKIPPGETAFSFDLSGAGVEEGDQVMILAVCDRSYTAGFPEIGNGDYLGYYLNETIDPPDPVYTIKPRQDMEDGTQSSVNGGIAITLDKIYSDFDATVNGQVTGEDTGSVTVIAYTGDIDGLSVDIDFNKVIGVVDIEKTAATADFSVDILPYAEVNGGVIENVYLIAWLDKNGNGESDGGDVIGYVTDENGLPKLLTINEGVQGGYVIELSETVAEPSGDTITMSGHVTIDPSIAAEVSGLPVFILVMEGTDISGLSDGNTENLAGFHKMQPGETDYSFDLSDSGLSAGDDVMVLAVCDREYVNGFPDITDGDYLGFYLDDTLETPDPAYILAKTTDNGDGTFISNNTGIDITLNKTLSDFEATVQGTVTGTDLFGTVTVIAYTGDIDSLSVAIDFDQVIGVTEVTKAGLDVDFSMDILPYAEANGGGVIENVYLIAWLDKNGNGENDGGDVIGYVTDENGLPKLNTIYAAPVPNTGYVIELSETVAEPSGDTITMSGHVTIDPSIAAEVSGLPVFILVMEGTDISGLSDGNTENLAGFYKMQPGETDYSIDLSDSGLSAGDDVMVLAVCDREYESGFPDITDGDYLGFYLDETLETPDPAYTLAKTIDNGDGTFVSENPGIDITLNKTLSNFDATVNGQVTGEDTGSVTVIAYTGEIDGLSVDIDFDQVIGVVDIEKTGISADFSMDILPYVEVSGGVIENVYLIAWLDKNGNGENDGGDVIGYVTDENGLPKLLTINEGVQGGYVIELSETVAEPSGDTITLSGHVTIDPAIAAEVSGLPVFILVMEGTDVSGLSSGNTENLAGFHKMQPGETDYSFDLSDSGLSAGDDVMILAVCDREYESGFPDITDGDYLGFYLDETQETPDPAYILAKTTDNGDGTFVSENTGIGITLNKTLSDFEATVQGTVTGTDLFGSVTVIAYTGEIDSLDVEIDFDQVIGYTEVTKAGLDVEFSMDILPYASPTAENEIGNVYLIAWMDRDGDGAADGGDVIGYVTDGNGVPKLNTIYAAPVENTGYTIDLSRTIATPSGDTIGMSGTVTVADDISVEVATLPIFILVLESDGTNDVSGLTDGDMSNLRHFEKLEPGVTSFSFDLSPSGLGIGDQVIVLAVCDRGYTGGFPVIDEGDYLGYYLDEDTLSTSVTLVAIENTGIDISLAQTYSGFEGSVSGTVTGEDTGDVTVIAYTGEIDSLSVDIDYDKVVGISDVIKAGLSVTFDMDILPLAQVNADGNMEGVYLIAWVDKDGDGTANGGDVIGYVTDANGMPVQNTIYASPAENTGFEIELSRTIATPSGDTITMNGTVTVDPAFTAATATRPISILVLKSDGSVDVSGLTGGDLSDLMGYKKLPAGETHYTLDLSSSGLAAGDQVMVLAVCDLDSDSTFPDISNGDYLGFYLDEGGMNPVYTLSMTTDNGDGTFTSVNDPVDINLNKVYSDFEATVSGNVIGDAYAGSVTVIAYAGEINSLNADIDFDDVIGYTEITKTANTNAPYTLDILPYATVTGGVIENVYLIAWLDTNNNGETDETDVIGYLEDANGLPALVTLNANDNPGKDITLSREIPVPSGADIQLTCTVAVKEGFDVSYAPLFILVLDASNGLDISALTEGELDNLVHFERLPVGGTEVTMDLSRTGLDYGDEIMILAVYDKEFTNGFPDIGVGDYVGYYIDDASNSPNYAIPTTPDPEGLTIPLNQVLYDYDTTLSGSIGGNGVTGTIMVVAYAGEINSMDFEEEFDMNQVVGYVEVEKKFNLIDVDFTLDVFPFGDESGPYESVYLFAWLDLDGDGTPDGGDLIGYYEDSENSIPALVPIDSDQTDLHIELSRDIAEPGPDPILVEGTIDVPDDMVALAASKGEDINSGPIYIIVLEVGEESSLAALGNGDLNDMVYFYKIPAGERDFSFDLAKAGMTDGQEVMFLAAYDFDYNKGFPSIGDGDYVGIYQDVYHYTLNYTLTKNGVNLVESDGADKEFVLSKIYYDHNASINYSMTDASAFWDILGQLSSLWRPGLNTGEKVTVVAIHNDGAEINPYSSELNELVIIDINYVVGYSVVNIPDTSNICFFAWFGGTYNYSMNLLPVIDRRIAFNTSGSGHLIEDSALNDNDGVYLAAILENDYHNCDSQTGVYLGYYFDKDLVSTILFPATLGPLDNDVNTPSNKIGFTEIEVDM